MGKLNLLIVVILALVVGQNLSNLNSNLELINQSIDHSLQSMQSRILGSYALSYGIQKLSTGEVIMQGTPQTWHTPQFAVSIGEIDSICYIPIAGDTVEVIPYIKNWSSGQSVASSSRALIDFFITQPEGQFGYYTMSDGSGNIVTDLSGEGFDGIMTNMDENDWITGVYGSGLDFDGEDDLLFLGEDITDRHEDDLTIATWLKTTSTQPVDWGNVITENSDYSGNQLNGFTLRTKYKLVGPTNIELFFEVVTNAGREGVYLQVFGTDIDLTNWHYIAGVLNITNQTIMVGIVDANIWAVNSISGTALPEKQPQSNITIGHIQGGSNNEGIKSGFKGQIDSFRTIDEAMSIFQLMQLMLYDGIKKPKLIEWSA
jgi:hypothetical protein